MPWTQTHIYMQYIHAVELDYSMKQETSEMYSLSFNLLTISIISQIYQLFFKTSINSYKDTFEIEKKILREKK